MVKKSFLEADEKKAKMLYYNEITNLNLLNNHKNIVKMIDYGNDGDKVFGKGDIFETKDT